MIPVRLFALLTIILLNSACEIENKSPVILQATHDGGSNICYFLFHKDNTYEWTSGSGLGVHFENGIYTLQDSIIILDEETIEQTIISKYLLIRRQQSLWDSTKVATYVFQVDATSKIIEDATPFLVSIDKRQH